MNKKLLFVTLVLAALVMAPWAQRGAPRIIIGKFFDDKYNVGGFDYTYPPSSSVEIQKTGGVNNSPVLHFKLDPNNFSGASICLYNQTFNLKPHLLDASLEFMIRGKEGGERAFIGLLDEEISDGKKTQVKIPLNPYVQITKEWQKVVIPLSDFPDRGLYWNQDKKTELPSRIDWDKIAEVRLSINQADNKKFEVWVDNIEIVKGTITPRAPKPPVVYWDEVEEKVDGPKNPAKLDGKAKVLRVIYDEGISDGGFTYNYGGKTAARDQVSGTPGNSKVWAMYIDDTEWSGSTISIGGANFVDLSKVRKTGGLYFWARGKRGGEKFSVGILDNQGNDVKTQTRVAGNDWIQLSKDEWRLVKIPLKRFGDRGKAWDASKQAEVTKNVRWDRIQEVRFSLAKAENRRQPNDPVVIYIDHMAFTENIDWVDPDLKWEKWNSKEADVVLHNFEKKEEWESSTGPRSRVKFEIGAGKLDGGSLNITEYLLGDWVDVLIDYEKRKSPVRTDWSKHWALQFDFYTQKPYQSVTIQLGDKGRELFVANAGGIRGRNTILVPFQEFSKFPYYQPPEAVQNGELDLDGIKILDFKPGGEGSSGWFQIDNIKLTNLRELPQVERPAVVDIQIKGDLKKVLRPINPGIHGVNVALWDGDLLLPETEAYVRNVNHSIIRYPGGLRADEDHWEEVLAQKDWMVDTDEFMGFMQRVGGEAMITVNFGRGTPEEAARWVYHTNIKNKTYVRYWEIGNELYGSWHLDFEKWGKDGGESYGRQARKFIEAMKKVDPTIKVGVVGVLEGPWNERVLKHTGDIADGLIVHHYPQHFGQENDFALLASPQTLPDIMGRVRNTIKQHAKNKDMEIWLTEWNSVDFNPGPQTLTMVNGLFAADYVGMLARVGVENSQYWDVHNDITPEGGDYGYLSRSYDEACSNCPRPSYWALKMASHSLRGNLMDANPVGDKLEMITTYLSVDGKKKSLMVINKNPWSDYKAKMQIPGFAGKATVQVLDSSSEKKGNEKKGPSIRKMDIKEGAEMTFPKHTITVITIE